MKTSTLKFNPKNPRKIDAEKLSKLVNSIKEFPKMMELRPIVIDSDNMVLGGNMRLKAIKEIGMAEIPDSWVRKADDLTPEEIERFVIADNVSGGEWDWESLRADWDLESLDAWGLDVPDVKSLNESELFDIEIPFYTPSEIKPFVSDLANLDKTKTLIEKIDQLTADDELKEILKARACFFTDFNFQNIADFYANENEDIKKIFEELGMVILAPQEALKNGFIELSEDVFELN